ncbi:hypothetical protein KFL_000850290 [Klebsormidium nitens]|uniref:Beta-lactamase class A catalytic domain-containing protein n=1 Tax=Klebsormidium nitens TaxID=105231 RepID=A0A1Y1HU06_KLENI|nr:hypothetical protein KFL_000850290 [Klebsormidium nitens]|eukprot:GAQ81613.1 hypothetical protein KFL_000850290 [Klebsormidium nitens]
MREAQEIFWWKEKPRSRVQATHQALELASGCFAAISTSASSVVSLAHDKHGTSLELGPAELREAVDRRADDGESRSGPADVPPPASQCIAEGLELESTIMEEKEEKGFGDEAAVGPLPRWETLESGDQDGKWWQSLPQPLPWFRRQNRAGAMSRTRKLKEELQRLVARQERKKKMHVGVVVEHLPSGERVSINGREPFPLASVAKVPIIIAAAQQLQEAEADPRGVRLTTRLRVTEDVKCIGSGELHERPSGETATLGECMELACVVSDNTAADLVLQQATLGRVRALLREQGLHHTDLCLSQRQAFLIAMGMTPSFRDLSATQIAKRWEAMSASQRAAIIAEADAANTALSVKSFLGAERLAEENYKVGGRSARRDSMAVAAAVDNTASPEDMALLLRRLAEGALLRPKWTRHCMGILSRQQYGKRRLPRGLPRDTRVYHKTGTIMGVCNDVGIIEVGSPDNLVVVAAMVSGILKSQYDREAEAVIAQVGRLAYKAYRPSPMREVHARPRHLKAAPGEQNR